MRKIIISLLLLCCFSISVYGQREGSIVNIGSNVSVAMVDDYFDYCHHRQLYENWCWAACVQMVLDYMGLSATQSSIVTRVYGDTYNVTADGSNIVEALDGWYVDGSYIHVQNEKQKNAKTLIDKLVMHSPLIVGLDESYSQVGHAYVLSHIFFERESDGSMMPTRVLVVNPAKSGDMEESLSWTSFYNRINTIVSISK